MQAYPSFGLVCSACTDQRIFVRGHVLETSKLATLSTVSWCRQRTDTVRMTLWLTLWLNGARKRNVYDNHFNASHNYKRILFEHQSELIHFNVGRKHVMQLHLKLFICNTSTDAQNAPQKKLIKIDGLSKEHQTYYNQFLQILL